AVEIPRRPAKLAALSPLDASSSRASRASGSLHCRHPPTTLRFLPIGASPHARILRAPSWGGRQSPMGYDAVAQDRLASTGGDRLTLVRGTAGAARDSGRS